MVKLLDTYKTYDNGTKALKGVTLTIEDGEFVFIVGPSGSGKSTIIKMLAAEVRPTSGKVMVNGFNIGAIRQREIPYLRRTIGVVFQDFRLRMGPSHLNLLTKPSQRTKLLRTIRTIPRRHTRHTAVRAHCAYNKMEGSYLDAGQKIAFSNIRTYLWSTLREIAILLSHL